jgi:hypothetical protein
LGVICLKRDGRGTSLELDGDRRSQMEWSEPTGPSAVSNLGKAGPQMHQITANNLNLFVNQGNDTSLIR